MTLRELIELTDPQVLAAVLAAPMFLALLLGLLHGRGNGGNSPWKYYYSVLVYLVCVPGMFAAVLTGYSVFFRNENLLDVNLVIYAMPIATMIVTLVVIRRNVGFDAVPGFDRLSGLMVMLGCSFALALAIHKTNIWLFFGGSIERLFVLALGIFALIKWGTYMAFRRKDEPRQSPPTFPAA